MKTYRVTLKRGNEYKTTYCGYRPQENEKFYFNGEAWSVVCWM